MTDPATAQFPKETSAAGVWERQQSRFDAVYYVHVSCNLRRIADYPNLWPYLRDLYQHPGIAETVDMDHIKRHYYLTHDKINPSGLVSDRPELDFDTPHSREQLG